MNEPLQPTEDACYRAMRSHDARFDGRFFTGVTSTGIYCRPVCRVRTPRRENCRFFNLAAQAEQAGFRPCLRCRPELAPLDGSPWSIQDASGVLAQQAARLMDEPQAWPDSTPSVEDVAARLGVTSRHLRRIFDTHLGVSPLAYLQTRRLLTAKQLLADTRLPVAQVALISGFSSVRRFNAAFLTHYGLNPGQLRREGGAGSGTGLRIRLGYRPPYDVAAMLGFLAQRQIHGIETVVTGENPPTADQQARGLAGPGLVKTLQLTQGARLFTGWVSARFAEDNHVVEVNVSEGLHPVLPQVIRRVRALLDLDADPLAINAALHASFPDGDGLRVPGTLNGFELAVRAILGQQITVAAGRTLAQRLVGRFGQPVSTPFASLTHLFPSATELARASGDDLGQLGIVKQRQAAIVALARAVDAGELTLHSGADLEATLSALTALPGIGDWTAQYIAMRALRWPDAFPAADVALHKAMGLAGHPHAARQARTDSQSWAPWRSYAVVRAWSLKQ